MKTNIWLSYDLGVDGDYESLYLWLDKNKARECGDSVAFLKYEYKSDLLKEISEEIKGNIKLRNKDRVYAIFREARGFYKGRFLFGGRKRAPWEGYALTNEDILDE